MHDRKTFRQITTELQSANLVRIRDRALEANKLAKALRGENRAKAYGVKHRALARLAQLGCCRPGEILVHNSKVILGLWVSVGGGFHIPLEALAQNGRSVRARQIAKGHGFSLKLVKTVPSRRTEWDLGADGMVGIRRAPLALAASAQGMGPRGLTGGMNNSSWR
jgi:hypothetical protein